MKTLNDLNSAIAAATDPRPWVALSRRERCTNCGFEHVSSPVPMREERKGHYVAVSHLPPAGVVLKSVECLATFAWCQKCAGERPIRAAIQDALDSAVNDRDLIQRVGHIIADSVKRRRLGGEGA